MTIPTSLQPYLMEGLGIYSIFGQLSLNIYLKFPFQFGKRSDYGLKEGIAYEKWMVFADEIYMRHMQYS